MININNFQVYIYIISLSVFLIMGKEGRILLTARREFLYTKYAIYGP